MKPYQAMLLLAAVLACPMANAQALTFEWAGVQGSAGQDEGRGIATDAAGNVCAVGIFEATMDADPGPGASPLVSAGGKDIFISKLDSTGALLWARRIGGADDDYGNAIAVDDSGNVYTTGYFAGTVDFDPGDSSYFLSSTGGFNDAFILKLSATGDFVWAKRIGATSPDYGYGITVDRFGSVYTTGGILETCDMDPGPGTQMQDPGIFVLKLDRNGNFRWARQLGQFGDNGYAIAADTAGNVYTTGAFSLSSDFDPGAGTFNLAAEGETDIFVSKLDSSGAFEWAVHMGGTNIDQGNAIAVDRSGSVFLTGGFKGTCDFDPGTAAYPLTAAGTWDAFTAKLDATGAFAWAFSMGGSAFANSDVGNGIAVDTVGNVYATGNFLGNVDFDPGTGSALLNSGSTTDIYILSVTTDGLFNWAGQVGSGNFNFNSGNAITTSANGHVQVTGSFVTTNVDFDPGAGVFPLSSAGGYDVFVLSLGPDHSTGVRPVEMADASFRVFSDPAAGQLTVRMDHVVRNARMVLYDAAGRLVHTEALPSLENTVHMPHVAPGMYSYVVLAPDGPIRRGALMME